MSASPRGNTYHSRPPQSSTTSASTFDRNGSGSQSSNLVLLRALFEMASQVSGKNLFPSNIGGRQLYTIRASKSGFTGRKKEVDFWGDEPQTSPRHLVQDLDPGL